MDIILKWLPAIYEMHIGSGDFLIRSLISTEEPFSPDVIIRLFEESSYNSTLKWTMAYVLSIGKTTDIAAWVIDQLKNNPPTFERYGFFWALDRKVGLKTKDELFVLLQEVFAAYFGEEPLRLYRKYGRETEIPFLEEQLKTADTKGTREIRKVIEAIKNRKKTFVFPPVK